MTAGLAVAVPDQAMADPTGDAGPPGFGDSGEATSDVTLITGDVVHVTAYPDGPPSVTVTPAPRADGQTPQFRVTTVDGDIQVHPTDVASLIGQRFDPELFNVSTLLEQGLDDRNSDVLPVIVEYGDDVSVRNAPFAGEQRELSSVNASAIAVDKTPGTAVSDVSTLSSSGVERVWLDRRIEAQLEYSTGQIGAPVAWDLGLDGSGVRVAVLDTGIDDNHPDLTGSVITHKNFTFDESATDGNGHGTHIAGTIAGDGSASGGDFQGVAPGVELVNAKVLDGNAGGYLSWLIEGMEWAVTQDVDIVNVSIGMRADSPEAPLVTAAVDNLSAHSGALFVVAAGNNGCTGCIGAPADAKSALTVGAVDRDDQLADFSNQGPNFHGFGLKPDVTAPGVEISAPRAEGTSGEGDYVAMSGTSMATPHVVGAAALLAQQYPELTAQELKALVMASANPADDLFGQGTGRVDVAAALEQELLPSIGSVDFGLFDDPPTQHDPVESVVSYRNETDEAVTVDLTIGATTDAGAVASSLTVSPGELTIEPGESAEALVSLDPAQLTDRGQFIGELTATAADGRRLVTTPVGFELGPIYHEVQISAVARDGRDVRPYLPYLSNVHTGGYVNDYCDAEVYCLRVIEGTYSLAGFVRTYAPWVADGQQPLDGLLNTTLVAFPEFVVDDDMTVVMDARDAVEVTVDTPLHPDGKVNDSGALQMSWSRTTGEGSRVMDSMLNMPGGQLEQRFFMTPTDEVTIGEFSASSRWLIEAPAIDLDAGGGLELVPEFYRADGFSDNSWQYPTVEGSRKLTVVDAGDASAADLAEVDVTDALALVRRSDASSVAEQSNAAAAAGAALVAIYNDKPGASNQRGISQVKLEVPTVRLSHEEGQALLDRLSSDETVTVTASGTQRSPYRYDLVYIEEGAIPAQLAYTADAKSLATVTRDFYALGDHATLTESSAPFQVGDEAVYTRRDPVIGAPRTRTDYYVGDSRVTWKHNLSTPEASYNALWPTDPESSLMLVSPWTTYQPGSKTKHQWYRGPLAPGFNPEYPVSRDGNILTIPTTGMVDASGNFTETPTDNFFVGIESEFVLRSGDEVIAQTTTVPAGTILLPSKEATEYHLSYHVTNHSDWAQLYTKTATEWTVTSAETAGPQVQPFMAVNYDFAVNQSNTLGPESKVANLFGLQINHPGDLRIGIRKVTVEVSFDDGKRWERAIAVPLLNGRYLIMASGSLLKVNNTGYLSVRTNATDARGNSVSQEIIRAVKLP